jgi:hypothetical protein
MGPLTPLAEHVVAITKKKRASFSKFSGLTSKGALYPLEAGRVITFDLITDITNRRGETGKTPPPKATTTSTDQVLRECMPK